MPGSVLEVVEAAYRLEQDDDAWLRGLAHHAEPLLGAGLGVAAYIVQAVPGAPVELKAYTQTSDDPRLETIARTMIQGTPPVAAEAFYETPLGFASSVEIGGEGARTYHRQLGAEIGMKDLLGVVSMGPQGLALTVAAPLLEEADVNPRTRGRWNRVAAHLGAALRLRTRLQNLKALDDAEAILDPDGRVVHAKGAAADATPRDRLRQRVLDIDRARRAGRADTDDALELWKALCAGRWSLIETFDTDGRRFMVACENAPGGAPDRALTAREQQVVLYAAFGHGDALIAYALDLSEETARAHVRRAMRKLGVASRLDLIRLVHALIDPSKA